MVRGLPRGGLGPHPDLIRRGRLEPLLQPVLSHNGGLATVPAGSSPIDPSVGSVGDSYDNALAETVNGLFKAEIIHRRGACRSFDAVEYATLEWVDWFNNHRLLGPIGNIPPAEVEANFYAALERSDMAA